MPPHSINVLYIQTIQLSKVILFFPFPFACVCPSAFSRFQNIILSTNSFRWIWFLSFICAYMNYMNLSHHSKVYGHTDKKKTEEKNILQMLYTLYTFNEKFTVSWGFFSLIPASFFSFFRFLFQKYHFSTWFCFLYLFVSQSSICGKR